MKKRARKNAPPDERRRDDGADAEAFEREMQDVVRLAPDPRGRIRVAPQITVPRARTLAERVDGPEGDFAAPGLDRREIKKLKRGDHAVEGRHDLHGMTAAQACASVERFIESSRHQQHRCICIVHGRGLHSAGMTSVLKARVRGFLRAHRSVLAYADAPRFDGGAGAVYVLLRKLP